MIDTAASGRGSLLCSDMRVAFGGLVALAGVSLEIAPCSITGLIGPNGSGKTTLLNVISGVLRSDTGSIVLDGQQINHLSLEERARLGVARTFQTLRLFDTLSVLDNVLLGSYRLFRCSLLESILQTKRAGSELSRRRAAAMDLLALFGDRLVPKCDDQVATLSYANRRRVEIARAIVSNPSVLLLDEPSAGMNPAETEELAAQLINLAGSVDCSMLLVEHKMDFITALCSTAYVLDYGSCLAKGTPEEIQKNPAVMEAFLGVE